MTILKTNDRNDGVKRLQQWLEFLGYNCPDDGVFCDDTRKALIRFQQGKDLTPDGIFGRKSYAALRAAVHSRYVALLPSFANKLPAPLPANFSKKVVCPAHKVGDGFANFRFRADAAYWYMQLFEHAERLGIKVTSAGADRSIKVSATAGRSNTSLHYIAIAFDLAIYTGMVKPETDAYVIERNGRGWTVWARCYTDRPEMQRTIQNPVTYARRNGTGKPVSGQFVNFTELARMYHFEDINPHASFFTGGTQLGAEWWHFQCEFALMPFFSTFGEELLTLHSADDIRKSPVAPHTDKVFGINWF